MEDIAKVIRHDHMVAMKFDYFLYLTNEDSKDKHREITSTDFTVDFTKPLNLECERVCTLLEIGLSGNIESDIL
ncbi:hypothetical protein BOW43_12420 [Solemya velum gill symbiont]|nr:hypothetical protein BOW43_12420 [Solemya velum gill symbiont]